MQDVQVDVDNGVITKPRAQLVEHRGQPFIQVRRTAELHEALSSLAALGVRKLGYRFRFYDDGDVTWEFTARRGAGRNPSVLLAIKAARYVLGQLIEDAIREATEEFIDLDRELHYECEAAFNPSTGAWALSGSGMLYETNHDLAGLDITFE